ncbi:hypothetical protein D4764_15G0010330, partial [Takifugu flavidus]
PHPGFRRQQIGGPASLLIPSILFPTARSSSLPKHDGQREITRQRSELSPGLLEENNNNKNNNNKKNKKKSLLCGNGDGRFSRQHSAGGDKFPGAPARTCLTSPSTAVRDYNSPPTLPPHPQGNSQPCCWHKFKAFAAPKANFHSKAAAPYRWEAKGWRRHSEVEQQMASFSPNLPAEVLAMFWWVRRIIPVSSSFQTKGVRGLSEDNQ